MERVPSKMLALLQDKTELIYLIDRLLTDLLAENSHLPP